MTEPPQYPSYPGPEQPAQPETPPPGQAPPPPPGYQPPPPPGYQPPPPPGYGQAPSNYGQAPPPHNPYQSANTSFGSYAGWWSRVGASLLDSLIVFAVGVVPLVVGAIIAFKDAETDPITDEITGGVNPTGVLIMVLAGVILYGFQIWNAGIRQGRTGQSLGKQIVGIQVVRYDNGQFLGAGSGFLRWLMMTILGGLCFLDYLWPLWDDKKQTWHDMIVGSVVVPK